MGVDIRLLGPPQVAVDGAPRRLKGRKSWGLLAALVLEANPTRREIADRLFADADDPMATLRWHLLQVRRAIEPAEIVESAGRLVLSDAGSVDAVEVLNGAVALDDVREVCRGDLLEGLSFAEAPSFDLWISLQRNRVAGAVGDTLRWAATMLARSDPPQALALLERALVSDPFNDAIHELAVEIHAAQSTAAAQSYVERVENLYRRELGIDLPESISRPLQRVAAAPAGPRLDSQTSARALMKVVDARLEANDYERALDAARRAAGQASESGDRNLQARALLTLARTLIHSLPGRDNESLGLLSRALQLAVEEDDTRLLSEIECEVGFVALIDGRYGAAEAALTRSIRWAGIARDLPLQAKARIFRGLCSSDRNDYESAEEDFRRALEEFSPPEAYRGNRGYARAGLARVFLRTGRVAEARSAATVALEEIESGGWHGTAPWPLVLLGESLLVEGDLTRAYENFQNAFALACEYPDACWESISLRGLALCAASGGEGDEARRLLQEALDRANRTSDTWKWVVGLILTDLVEAEGGAVPEHLAQGRRIASHGPMPDLVERLQRFGDPQTQPQTSGR